VNCVTFLDKACLLKNESSYSATKLVKKKGILSTFFANFNYLIESFLSKLSCNGQFFAIFEQVLNVSKVKTVIAFFSFK